MVQHYKRNFNYDFLRKNNGKGRILCDEEYECSFLKINVKDLFQPYVDLKILVMDVINLIDGHVKYNKHQQLKQFIFDFDNQPHYGLEFYQKYNHSIHVAIQCQDIESLEFLWGMDEDYHILGNDHIDNLYYACEYGTLKTFQHVLYSYCNYVDYSDDCKFVSIEKMKELALLNIDSSVKIFIDQLFIGLIDLLEDKDKFYGCHNENIEKLQFELQSLDPNDDMYEYEQNNIKIAIIYFTNLRQLNK